MPEKNNRYQEEEKEKKCDMDIDKNDLAFAAMDVIIKKDAKK